MIRTISPIIKHDFSDYRKNQASKSKNIYDSKYQVRWLFDKVYKHGKVNRPKYNRYFIRRYVHLVCRMSREYFRYNKLKSLEVFYIFAKNKPLYLLSSFFYISKRTFKYFIRKLCEIFKKK